MSCIYQEASTLACIYILHLSILYFHYNAYSSDVLKETV